MSFTGAGRSVQFAGVFAALTLALGLSRLYSHLLFHSLAELFAITVAASTFMLAWNARRVLDNHYLLLIGISSLFTGGIDLVHTLSYRGMGVLEGATADEPTQLWIASRYLQSVSFLIAPLFFGRKLKPAATVGIYAAAASLLVASVFTGAFPACYIEGGLTSFKIASEYSISAIFTASVLLLYRRRAEIERSVCRQLAASILLMTAAELTFTLYSDVYGAANVAGHLLRFLGCGLIYRAIVVTGLVKPYDLLFRDLKRSEERYRAFIAGSTEGMCRIELKDGIATDLPADEQVERLLANAFVAECNEAYARMHGSANAGALAGSPLARALRSFEPGATETMRAFVLADYRVDGAVTHERNTESGRYVAGSLSGVVENGRLVRAWCVERDITERRLALMERDKLIAELRQALTEVKKLSGLLPICANCKKVRDDQGYWMQVESYVSERTNVLFSHGICPDCATELYPDYVSNIRVSEQ